MHSDELEHIHAWACENAEKLSGVVANNPGQLALSWPVPVSGGQGLNVMNHACAAFYAALTVNRLTVSCELNQKELRELFASGGNYVMEAYGRTQLMLLNHCPRRTEKRGRTAGQPLQRLRKARRLPGKFIRICRLQMSRLCFENRKRIWRNTLRSCIIFPSASASPLPTNRLKDNGKLSLLTAVCWIAAERFTAFRHPRRRGSFCAAFSKKRAEPAFANACKASGSCPRGRFYAIF